MSMRLQRYLALCGIASRRASETLIREGRVTVNGAIAALGSSVDPDHDEVRVNGKPILGRASVWDVVRHVDTAGAGLPAWVPDGFVGGIEADNPYLPELADTEPCPPPENA